MKLATATDLTYSEVKLTALRSNTIVEEGAPRWSFDYANAQQDAEPDILVLGDWDHPTSGNQLVGGINLHYLDEQQLQALRQALPQIMRGSNLKFRYQLGKQLLPDIFDNFYRTYRSDLISGVQPDELDTWEPEEPPMPPPVRPRQPVPPPQEPLPPPEFRPPMQPPRRPPQPPPVQPQPPPALQPSMPPQPRPRPARPLPEPPIQPLPPGPRQQPVQPVPVPVPQPPEQMDLQTLANAYRTRMGEIQQQQAQQNAMQAKQQAIKNLRKERQKNLTQLMAPPQEPGDPLEPPQRQGRLESVEYYSPVQDRYITEEIEL